jgi:hypothetical protein
LPRMQAYEFIHNRSKAVTKVVTLLWFFQVPMWVSTCKNPRCFSWRAIVAVRCISVFNSETVTMLVSRCLELNFSAWVVFSVFVIVYRLSLEPTHPPMQQVQAGFLPRLKWPRREDLFFSSEVYREWSCTWKPIRVFVELHFN